MFNDTISDMLTRIRNANLIKSKKVSIPFTRISHQICQILEKEGFIKSFKVKYSKEVYLYLKYKRKGKKPGTINLRRISKGKQGNKPGTTNLQQISKGEQGKKPETTNLRLIKKSVPLYGKGKKPETTNLQQISKGEQGKKPETTNLQQISKGEQGKKPETTNLRLIKKSVPLYGKGKKPGTTNLLRIKKPGQGKKQGITNLRRISKPGLRIYANHKEIPKVLGGMGVVIVSTSQGIMTGQEAQVRHIGGELLCSVW